jgi:hypothetical protein
MTLCTHYVCRCARACELAEMADRAADPRTSLRLLVSAIVVHEQQVECRIDWAAGKRPGAEPSPKDSLGA